MEAVHSFSPWLRPPPKPLAPVTARMFSSSRRKSWPRARNSWGTSAASCRVWPLLSPPLLPLLFLGDLPALFFEKSEHGPNPPLSADLYFPVEPKPPAPRWVSSSWSTIFTWAWTTGTTISWAMRSAGWMT